MKKLSILFLAFVMVTMFSCRDESLTPYEPFVDMEYGAYARLLSSEGGLFYTDIENSTYSFTVEFYDENNGAGIENYEWTVQHKNKATGVNSGEVAIFSASKSSYSVSPDGLPSTTFDFTFTEVLDALGLTKDDINGGDDFVFDGVITTNDGRKFGSGNVGPSVVASAPFSGWFRFTLPALCTSEIGGTFDVVTEAWCGSSWEGQISWTEVEGSEGEYISSDYSNGAYEACYGVGSTLPGGTLRVIDACDIISTFGADRWGDNYTPKFNITEVNGNVMVLEWENTYAEGGTTTFTRTDGQNWPEGLRTQ